MGQKDNGLSQICRDWLNILQTNGYRITQSRRTVVEIIARSNQALTPLELYDMARARHPGVGLVTIYRTLDKLEEFGLIQRVHQPQGCQAFIAAFTGHQHMILCSDCGRVVFFSGDNLEPFFLSVGEKTGFQIQDHWLQLFGTCSSCQAKKD
jgi:Fur family transcriptional regulator, ferric uptake regulator